MRRAALYILCISLSGCGSSSLSYKMPVQRVLPQAPDPPPLASFIDFASGDSVDYVVRDIDPTGDWRWARDHPELQFHVEREGPLRLIIDFAIADRTFQDTGPVTLTVKVNRVEVGTMRCDRGGEYHFEHPVPVELIPENGLTLVTAEANPVWVSPGDGTHFGYLIRRAGFPR